MKKNLVAAITGICGLFMWVQSAHAALATLALRSENPIAIYGGTTTRTVETTFGTNLATLPFTKTTTYDFFSPPLTAPTSLTSQEHAEGTVFMTNAGVSSAHDFVVEGRMFFYDYNPATGEETLLADTGNSADQDVKHGTGVSWSVPKVSLAASRTVATGHLLHIAVSITLESGNPGGFGQFLYNGPEGASTSAVLPHRGGVTWSFALPGSIFLCLAPMPDGCKRLSCTGGIANRSFSVQAATSLVSPNWTTIGTVSTDGTGAFNFTDLESSNYPCRYYRLTAL